MLARDALATDAQIRIPVPHANVPTANFTRESLKMNMMAPTADQIELFISMAESGLGERCNEAWVQWCSQTLREMVTEYPQEQQIPLFLLSDAPEPNHV